MQAVAPPAIVQSAQADEQTGVIEIVGSRSDQVQKIDRRSYRVKDNPNSAQADTLQLLRGLPAVTITPDDQIMLLGAPNVTILVDDRPLYGNPVQYLRTLHGSDIERIEIITNPSAQYSSVGTGGIINIVLRKQRDDGLTGSATGEGSTLGSAEGSATVKYKKDKWVYELQAQGNSGRKSRSSYHKLRTVELSSDAPPTINTEDGSGRSDGAGGFLSAKATRLIDDKTSVIAGLFGGASHGRTDNDVEFRGLTPEFLSFSERQRSSDSANFVAFELTLDHKGSRKGETLKIDTAVFGNPRHRQRLGVESEDSASFSVDRREKARFAYADVKWEHPIGTRQILSLGANWFTQDRKRRYRFSDDDTDGTLGPDSADAYHGTVSTLATYATFQQKLGSWTVMPGLRFERYSRDIRSPGRSSSGVTRATAFPSFHLEHPFGKAVTFTASYSKRIDHPDLDDLRPYPIVSSIDTILLGNPDLKDQSTDSYEVNLHYRRKNLDAGLIIYDRETSRLWANSYSVNAAGLNVVTPINSGHKRDRGAQFDVTSPLLRRVKGTASVNLFDSRVPIDPVLGTASRSSFRYTANATLEWGGSDHHDKPGDIVQLQADYSSPSQSYQIRYRGRYSLNLSYTHSFSRTLSVTGSLKGIGPTHNRHRLDAPLVQEDYDAREKLPVLKIKLVKTLGNPK